MFPATHRYQTSFVDCSLDAPENAGPILQPMTQALIASALILLLASLAPAALFAQAQQRSILRQRPRQAGCARSPSVEPGRLRRPRGQDQREMLKVAPERRADADRAARRQQPARRACDSRLREALPAFIYGGRWPTEVRGKHQICHHDVAERPTINTDYTSDEALLLKGAGASSRCRAAARTCWTGSSR